MKAGFFLRTALNHLRRGEQRVWAALACITFGVMSLTAMMIVSQSLTHSLLMTPREQIGGDVNVGRQSESENVISPEAEAGLQALQAEGVIERYLLAAQAGTLLWHLPNTGENHFASRGLGIDPAAYPLAGRLVLAVPENMGLPSVLAAAGDLVISRDLADTYGLAVDDTLVLADLDVGRPVSGVVRGIASDTPNHEGGRIYYTIATAEALAGGQRAVNVAVINAPQPQAALDRLLALGWWGISTEQITAEIQANENLFTLLLKGAGMLGLMVGGIGIANTMQVLLRRRQREIAIWKTVGYTAGELQALFVLEAALLGAAGSLLGTVLAVWVSRGLITLITRLGTSLVVWSLPPEALVTGALAGLATTVIFALWAIVRAAQVPPVLLLRDAARTAGQQAWPQTVLLMGLLAVPFTALTAVIMGSVGTAIGVLLFALAGLVALGGGLGGLAWVATRLLRVPGLPLVRLAQSSLRRRGLGLVFAMIALFTGVVALALGVVMTQDAQAALEDRTPDFDSYEVALVAPAAQEAAMRAALAAEGVTAYSLGYSAGVAAIEVAGDSESTLPPRLLGQETPRDYALNGAAWGSDPQGAYAPEGYAREAGSEVEVVLADGRRVTLPIVGHYQQQYWTSLRLEGGLLMPAALSKQLALPETVLAYVDTPGDSAALSAALGLAVPSATVVDMVAYAGRFTQNYRNLFLLAVTMAGLALLAGVLLVANSVSLAMLDRQYEIGVLKAVGYTRGQVLATLAVEYGLMASIASGAALVAVQVFLWVVGSMNPLAGQLLQLDLGAGLVILATGVGLTLLTVVGGTWRATGVSAVVLLNERG